GASAARARIARFGALMDVRRMIGVGAFAYAASHILLYVFDQMFDLGKVASEIVLRLYLTIGFTALTGLAVLAATSTDGMVRNLGPRRWQRLHQLIYVIAGLALIHFFQQTKADEWLPTFVAGLFAWMIGYRLVMWRGTGETGARTGIVRLPAPGLPSSAAWATMANSFHQRWLVTAFVGRHIRV